MSRALTRPTSTIANDFHYNDTAGHTQNSNDALGGASPIVLSDRNGFHAVMDTRLRHTVSRLWSNIGALRADRFVLKLQPWSSRASRLRNTRHRSSTVVGQIFAYAAGLWEITYEEFDRLFAASIQAKSLADAIRAELSESDAMDWREEDFRAAVSHNLRAGRFTLIIAVDRITDELKRIVPYINTHTIPEVRFIALEVGYVKDGDVEIIQPLTYGQESVAEKQAVSRSDQEQVNEVFRAIYRLAQESGAFAQVRAPSTDRSYYTMEKTHQAVQYEPTFGWDKLKADVVINHAKSAVNARLFELLKARADSIQESVDGEITWNFQEGRKLQRLEVIRTIDRPNIANSIDELARWATERLIELRKAIEPGLEADLANALAIAQRSGETDEEIR